MSEELNEVLEEEVMPEEEIDTPVDELEEVEETEETEEESPDPIAEWLKEQTLKVDGEEYKYDDVEQLLQDARIGKTVDRVKEQRDKYRNDPGYKFMQDYMKTSGYKDMSKFVHDIQVNQKQSDFVSKGMSDEDAKAAAEEFIKNRVPDADPREADINRFLDWHESKFGQSLDSDKIPQPVMEAYEKGESMKEAFLEHKLENTKVETEQETIKKIIKNKETSSGELNKSKHNTTKDMTVAQIDKLLSGMTQKQQSDWADANYAVLEKAGYFNR